MKRNSLIPDAATGSSTANKAELMKVAKNFFESGTMIR